MSTRSAPAPAAHGTPRISHRGALHWESWLLRLALLGTVVYQVVSTNREGLTVAAEGLVVSLVPLLVQRLSKTHVPRLLEFTFVLAMALQFISESLKLFELFYYWDKLVHPTEIALSSMVAVYLLLGFRDRRPARMSRRIAAALAWLFGATLGAFWEFIEFTSDWFGNADLQKSNADTMTDMLANDIGAFFATLLAVWIYHHWTGAEQRDMLGRLAEWFAGGPGKLFDRHGRVMGAVVALLVLGLIGAANYVDRNPPSLPAGTTGGAQQWQFVPTASGPAVPMLGDWQGDPRGICRVNLEHPKPGSEKMGLLALAPGMLYGDGGQTFAVSTHYFEERPHIAQGSEMDAGIAFGVRGPDDFYLLEENALHDILRLDRFIHGKRRDVREQLYRTRGNEWHDLQVDVRGDRVDAAIDGQRVYEVQGLEDTSGGIGLWGRTASATCFSAAAVEMPAASSSQPPTSDDPAKTRPDWRWGKVAHAAAAFVLTLLIGLAILGYRSAARLEMPAPLAALATIAAGVTFGAFWEFQQFYLDWIRGSDLQKSNADTMTDLLATDLAAIVATLIVFRVFHHGLGAGQRDAISRAAGRLGDRIGGLLTAHGRLVGSLVTLLIAVLVAVLWIVDRSIPGLTD